MPCEECPTHAARVAAIASELGSAMAMDPADRRDLHEAALWHESPFLGKPSSFERLAADLGLVVPAQSRAPHSESTRVKDVLAAFYDSRRLNRETEPLVTILRSADRLDEQLERELFEQDSAGTEPLGRDLLDSALAALRTATRDELRAAALRLPMFPEAYLEAMRTLTASGTEPHQIEKVAARDPVLAGALLRTANSAMYGRRGEVRSLLQAIARIGPDFARQVLLATMLRGVFAGPSLRVQWNHAIEAAELAADLASDAGVASLAEASLAALVHDIGLVALEFLSAGAIARRDRLVDGGVPLRGAEWIVFGFDHAEAGAVVLDEWRFPAGLIEAVRCHHTPDATTAPLAPLLYLVEFLTCSEEDYPSAARLHSACRRLHIDLNDLIRRRSRNRLGAAL